MPEAPRDSDTPRLDGVRVLVVDDAPQILDLVRLTLEHFGAEVTAANSAVEALEALERQRPDVLVSDISMPGHDGFWLIGRVRALARDRGGQTPAAALTALTSAHDRARVLDAGFQSHIPKPFFPAQLAGVVEILGRQGVAR